MNAKCIPTDGALPTCDCDDGYEGSGQAGDCKKIVCKSQNCKDVCKDPSKNDCDRAFAKCLPSEASYKCQCREGLMGDGTAGNCRLRPDGNPNVYCDILMKPCTEYQTCQAVGQTTGNYECVGKSKMGQIATFFSEGGSANTPDWVWGVVSVGSLLGIVAIFFFCRWLYNWQKGQNSDKINEGLMVAAKQDEATKGPGMGPEKVPILKPGAGVV